MSDVKIEQRELSDGQRAYYAWLNAHFLSDNQIERIKAEFEYLQTENAKLRELVRIAGTYCVNGLCGMDDGCPLYLGKPYCAFTDRMRELGVE